MEINRKNAPSLVELTGGSFSSSIREIARAHNQSNEVIKYLSEIVFELAEENEELKREIENLKAKENQP